MFKTAALAFALAAAAVAPASAATYSQLAANAGLSASEAAGMTLSQIATYHFNRGESVQDRQTVPGEIVRGDAGDAANLSASARNMPEMSLREIAAARWNRGESEADKITVVTPTPGSGADRSQLAASAGLRLGAEGYSLTEIAATYFNRGVSEADKQKVRNRPPA